MGETLVVAGDGTGTHRTLPQALRAAPPGATIRLERGSHILSRGLLLRRPRAEAEEMAFLPHIGCPTLVVRGSESPILSRESAEQMARASPDCRWVEIAESGHSVYADNFADFMAVVRSFSLLSQQG